MSNVSIPLTPVVARHIIAELFRQQSTWKRDVLISEVKRVHAERGGVAGNQDVSAVVTKALGQLQEDGLIRNPAYGHWTLVSSSDPSPVSESTSFVAAAIPPPEENLLVAEKEIGSGEESVYVYF